MTSSENSKIWRMKNKERVVANRRAYYKANREGIIAKAHKYYSDNLAARREYGKRFRIKHRERLLKQEKAFKQGNPVKFLFYSAKSRAAKKGLEFSLKMEDISIPFSCPVLQIPLQVGNGRWTANSPSLDRVDPSKGYVRGNVIVVSFRANNLKSDATVAELRKIADFYHELEMTQHKREDEDEQNRV